MRNERLLERLSYQGVTGWKLHHSEPSKANSWMANSHH